MATKKTTKKTTKKAEETTPVEEIVTTTEVTTEETTPVEEDDGISVADPEILRPKELPLVVTPGKKGWANPEQEEYARILNGYAYSNPDKFKAKKDKLVANLRILADQPQKLAVFTGDAGSDGKLAFKNHITQG